MKAKFIKLAMVLICTGLVASAQKMQVTGHIVGLKQKEIIMIYYKDGSFIGDTVNVDEGRFSWIKNMPEPVKVMVKIGNNYPDFFAEAGNIRISGTADSLNQLKIEGSKTHDESVDFSTSLKDLTDEETEIYKMRTAAGKGLRLTLDEKLKSIRVRKTERAYQYVSQHPKSAFSLQLIIDRLPSGDYSDLVNMFEKLDPEAKFTAAGKRIALTLPIIRRSELGTEIMSFSQKDTNGRIISITDFRGKYVLIDFWASWCGPCRKENPNVLKAYNRYKNQNFTVVGLSLDDKEINWKKAIKDDQMPWPQLSDLRGWENEVAAYYDIVSIPRTFLIDPQGRIIGKDLRGDALNKMLEVIFD